jgi:primosomal protein N' (replication factor Y)
MSMVIRVALDTPLRRTFDYLPPLEAPTMRAGSRVRIPFGRQQRIGLIVSIEEQSELEIDKLKRIHELIDTEPLLDPPLLSLLLWAADYYHHPLGEVLISALPKRLREGAPLQVAEECWSLTESGHALGEEEPRRAPKQRALLARLRTPTLDSVLADQLQEHMPGWRETARALLKRGWVQCLPQAPPAAAPPPAAVLGLRPAGNGTPVGVHPRLNEAQQRAIEAIETTPDGFRAWLLHGITGSGKTEVYLRLTETQLRAGRQVLVLVPEIGLTPQLIGRFAERFPQAPLAVLHSGLTDGERLQAWRRASRGEARLLIGTRSAVFAALPQLGLILVDEEHDASFKQQDGGFRYSARDLALRRAQQLGIPIVLGSATPSLESLHNVSRGRLARLELPERAVTGAQLPTLRLIDLRQERVHAGLSTTAVTTLQRHLAEGGQALVFINRRGYAPTLACTACGWVAPCLHCDARLTVHRQEQRLRCHHCGADRELPRQCPQCGYAVKAVGQGTERIEESLTETFPGIGIARLDRDVVRRSDQLEAVMERVGSGAARILVGTQMVAKGHDFPDVTLVIVLNADHGLFSTDFRAAERLAQTIVQVAGRAGRAERAGEVLIQTEYPEHPLLRGLLTGGYEAFADAALEERRQAFWPPFSHLAALRASGLQVADPNEFLDQARQAGEALRADSVRILGPAPAAMARRAGRYHAQLLLESADRTALHRFVAAWLTRVETLPIARKVRWALDVDPLELF